MGYGIDVKCSKCGFGKKYYMGSGMLFSKVYEELVEDVLGGEYGDEWKQFFEENSGAAIMAEKKLYQCPSCNHLEADYDLSLYLSKSGNPPEDDVWRPWSDNGHEFQLAKRYVHMCPRCSSEMQEVTDYKANGLPCPECGNGLSIFDAIHWD